MFIINAVTMFFQAVIYLIVGMAVMSWFIRPGDRLYPLYKGLCQVTEPILQPCRKLTERLGLNRGMDFSPVVALLLLWGLNWVVVELLKNVLL